MNQPRTKTMFMAPQASASHPIALITGAAQRIGQAIALSLAQQGWDIAVHYRQHPDLAESTCEQIRQMGCRAVAIAADLADETQTSQLMHRCIETLGVPHCLVNNASLFAYDHATDVGYESLVAHHTINVAAPLLLSRLLYENTPENQDGVIINFLDQKLGNLNDDHLSYTLSKSALQTATIMLAKSFAPKLRVMGIAPGMTLPAPNQTDADFAKTHAMTPLGHASNPSQLADTVWFILQNRALTGSVIWVDGGQHLQSFERDFMFL